MSTRTTRSSAGAAGRAGKTASVDPTTAPSLSSVSTKRTQTRVFDLRDKDAPLVQEDTTRGASPPKVRNPTSRRVVAATGKAAAGGRQQARSPNAMDIDTAPVNHPQSRKSREKRKRSQSTSADVLPNEEDNTQSAQKPYTKKAKTARTTGTMKTSQNLVAVTSPVPPSSKLLPPKVKRKGALPKINVDKPDTSDPEAVRRSGVSGHQPQFTDQPSRPQDVEGDREEHFDEDGEDINPDAPASGDSENDDDNDVPEPHDEGDLSNLGGEAVIFTRVPSGASSPVPQDTATCQRQASPPNKKTPHTPSSSSSIPASAIPMRATSGKKTLRERKLEEEMPMISAGKPLGGKPSGFLSDSEQAEEGTNSDDDEPVNAWLPHTDITRALKRKSENRFGINIKKCPDEVQEVLHASFTKGMFLLAFGDGAVYTDAKVTQSESFVTPFGLQDIERISLDALVTAAETLGFDGQYDIADRLETGSERKYRGPIRSYTAHRLRTYRGDIKKAAASAYPSAAQLATLSRDAVSSLLESSNFLYPRLPSGDYQYGQPFAGLGLTDVVKAAFFGNTLPNKVGTQNIGKLTSSLPTAPHELEIPDHMLAMAAAAINSVLIDQLHPQTTKSGTTEFAGTTLENAYKAYMAILINMRVKGLLKYHTLMHGICMTATGGRAIALHGHAAQNDILANVDWENIAD